VNRRPLIPVGLIGQHHPLNLRLKPTHAAHRATS
jgi:hypothetical protein